MDVAAPKNPASSAAPPAMFGQSASSPSPTPVAQARPVEMTVRQAPFSQALPSAPSPIASRSASTARASRPTPP